MTNNKRVVKGEVKFDKRHNAITYLVPPGTTVAYIFPHIPTTITTIAFITSHQIKGVVKEGVNAVV